MRARWYAADSPLGPAPMTRTLLPVAGAGAPTRQRSRIARSPRKRSTAWIETAWSSLARLHDVSHG